MRGSIGGCEIAHRLRDYSQTLDTEVRERRARLTRTEDRIKGLVDFIANGERSEYIVSALRDLEVQAKTERAAIERIQREAQEPLHLPSPDEIVEAVYSFDAMLAGDAEIARARLRRWLKDGVLRVARAGKGFELRGGCFPLAVVAENQTLQNPKSEQQLRTLESNVRSGGMTSPRPGRFLIMFAFSIRRNGPTRYRSTRRLVTRTPKT